MDTPDDRFLSYLMAVVTAWAAAITLGHIAHFEFGFSRQQIGAAVIAALLAVEFFGKKLRKPK